MRHRTVTLLRMCTVASFGLGVLTQLVLLPWLSGVYATDAPEFAYLRVPLLVISIGAIACWQVVLVSTWHLLSLTRDDEVFTPSARPWVDVIIAALAVLSVLGVGTGLWLGSFTQAGPATVILAPMVGGSAAGAVAMLVSVMKSLLVRASEQRAELADLV